MFNSNTAITLVSTGFFGNTASGGGAIFNAAFNIALPPLFVDADGVVGSPDDDLRLLSSFSAAVDSGDNVAIKLPVDYEGDLRKKDGDLDGTKVVDMGRTSGSYPSRPTSCILGRRLKKGGVQSPAKVDTLRRSISFNAPPGAPMGVVVADSLALLAGGAAAALVARVGGCPARDWRILDQEGRPDP